MKKTFILVLVFFIIISNCTVFAQSPLLNSLYSIQVGFYKNKTSAQNLVNKIKRQGLPVYKVNRKGIYSVFVGDFKSISKAQDIDEYLKKLGYDTQIYAKSPKTKTYEKYVHNDSKKVTNKTPTSIKRYTKNIFQALEKSFNGYTTFFNADENWNIKKCIVNVFYSKKGNNNLDATLFVYLNDVIIKKALLEENSSGNIKVSIPERYINKGLNKLHFKVHSNKQEIVFHKKSHILINYVEKPNSKDPRNFPISSIILIPDNPKKEHISTALTVAADFGRHTFYKDLDIKILTYGKLQKSHKQDHLIVIGDKSFKNHFLYEPIKNDLDKLNSETLIKETSSPLNSKKQALYIVSDDINSLSYRSKNIGLSKKVTLKDLGYENVPVKDFFHQRLSFSNIPIRKLQKNSFIDLHFRYSKALDFDNSYVKVFFNGAEAARKKLNKLNSGNDSIKVPIPEINSDSESLNLEVVFFLVPKDDKLLSQQGEDIWAMLLNKSCLCFSKKQNENFVLENYPNFFIENGILKDLLFVFPDNINSQHLAIGVNIAAFIGQRATFMQNIEAVKESEFNKEYSNKNLIIIEAFKDNHLIKKNQNIFPSKSQENLSSFMASGKSNDDISILFLDKSPFNQKRCIMMVTGDKIKPYVVTKKKSDYLKGNVFLIDLAGNIKTLYLNKASESVKNTEVELTKGNKKSFIVFCTVLFTISFLGGKSMCLGG